VAEIKQVLVPDIGDYKDVSIIEVMVKVGDTIKAEDNLVTLETDKAAMDVPSPYAGVIKEMKVKLGDKVSQGSLILLLESDSAAFTSTPAPSRGGEWFCRLPLKLLHLCLLKLPTPPQPSPCQGRGPRLLPWQGEVGRG
jgi:pyruvate/2-oxoglutarate dehydrogenase complex dihydrolipoamide acyltransferase (E2) component